MILQEHTNHVEKIEISIRFMKNLKLISSFSPATAPTNVKFPLHFTQLK